MNPATAARGADLPPVKPETLAHVRPAVADLLTQSPAFRSLDRDKQRQIAGDTARIAAMLADPAAPSSDPAAGTSALA
jgi:hypothetical protein